MGSRRYVVVEPSSRHHVEVALAPKTVSSLVSLVAAM